jgi:hypothetical protein
MNEKVCTASLGMALLMLASSCGGRETEALGAAAVQVGMVAVNRAATGDCWGVCEYGTRCNRSSGYCEPDPEPTLTPRASASANSGPQTAEPALLPLVAPSTNDPESSFCTEAASCTTEGESCSASHDECIRRCECRDARWSCLETCR